MNIVSQTSYRSAGRGVNCTDDMVRVVVDFTQREFKRLEALFGNAPKVQPNPPKKSKKHIKWW